MNPRNPEVSIILKAKDMASKTIQAFGKTATEAMQNLRQAGQQGNLGASLLYQGLMMFVDIFKVLRGVAKALFELLKGVIRLLGQLFQPSAQVKKQADEMLKATNPLVRLKGIWAMVTDSLAAAFKRLRFWLIAVGGALVAYHVVFKMGIGLYVEMEKTLRQMEVRFLLLGQRVGMARRVFEGLAQVVGRARAIELVQFGETMTLLARIADRDLSMSLLKTGVIISNKLAIPLEEVYEALLKMVLQTEDWKEAFALVFGVEAPKTIAQAQVMIEQAIRHMDKMTLTHFERLLENLRQLGIEIERWAVPLGKVLDEAFFRPLADAVSGLTVLLKGLRLAIYYGIVVPIREGIEIFRESSERFQALVWILQVLLWILTGMPVHWEMIREVMERLVPSLRVVIESVDKAYRLFEEILFDGVPGIVDDVDEMADGFWRFVGALVEIGTLRWAAEIAQDIQVVGQWFVRLAEDIRGVLGRAFSEFGSWAGEILRSVGRLASRLFTEEIPSLVRDGVNMFVQAWDVVRVFFTQTLTGWARSAWETIRGWFESLFEFIRSAWRNLMSPPSGQVGLGGLSRQMGGIIPGIPGQPVPVIAHGGEMVLTAQQVNRLVQLLEEGVGGKTVIQLTLDGRVIAEVALDALRRVALYTVGGFR